MFGRATPTGAGGQGKRSRRRDAKAQGRSDCGEGTAAERARCESASAIARLDRASGGEVRKLAAQDEWHVFFLLVCVAWKRKACEERGWRWKNGQEIIIPFPVSHLHPIISDLNGQRAAAKKRDA